MEIINENVPGIRVSDVRSDKRPGAGVDAQRGNMKLSWKKVNTKGRKTKKSTQKQEKVHSILKSIPHNIFQGRLK